MPTPSAGSTPNPWISRIATWNQFRTGVRAFVVMGALQFAILTPLINDFRARIQETRMDFWKVVITSGLLSLPTAISALCAAIAVIEVCGLLNRSQYTAARQLCLSRAGGLMLFHGVVLVIFGGVMLLIPVLILDFGFQISLKLLLWSQLMPRNEMESQLNKPA